MTYGMRFRNGGGTFQVDGQNVNFALRYKGTGTFSNLTYGAGSVRYATFTVTADTPFVAISCPYATVCAKGAKSGGNWQFFIYSTEASAGAGFTYYVFDKASQIGVSGGYGVRIRNPSSGEVVFDSRQKPMMIVLGASTETNPSAAMPSGRTLAIVTSKFSYQHNANYVDGSTGTGQPPHSGAASGGLAVGGASTAYSTAKFSGGALVSAMDEFESYSLYDYAESSYGDSTWNFFAVDVTNY